MTKKCLAKSIQVKIWGDTHIQVTKMEKKQLTKIEFHQQLVGSFKQDTMKTKYILENI